MLSSRRAQASQCEKAECQPSKDGDGAIYKEKSWAKRVDTNSIWTSEGSQSEFKDIKIRLDDKLTWNSNLKHITNCSQTTMAIMGRAVGTDAFDDTQEKIIKKHQKCYRHRPINPLLEHTISTYKW